MSSTNKKPIIFSVDDDPAVLRSLKRDLRNTYKSEYRIISTESAKEALSALPELKKQGDVVALFISDQRMPEMPGVDFLEQARKIYPGAKQILLTAYSDTEAAIKAINDVQLDYYLLKPWNPPEEKLYPVVNDLLDEWQSSYIPQFQGIRLVGYQYSPKSHKIKDFLSGNLIPYQWLDIKYEKEAVDLLDLHQIDQKELPAIIFEDGEALPNPDLPAIAKRVGLKTEAEFDLYDVVIIGAGPSGLAAAVYGGSEGLKTLLLEMRAPGGQAGTSSRIENYLGFPKGLSGAELTRRAVSQASRFGVEILAPREVVGLEIEGHYKKLRLADGTIINTKAIVVTTGVSYRHLPAKNIEKYTGAGVYYGAAMTEANSCKNQHVFVVGGGNSAGQGAVYLSKFAKKVTILIRRTDLNSSMSSYLIDQINAIENIEVVGRRQVTEICGEEHLEKVVLENLDTQTQEELPAGALFVFIGARPRTDWLSDLLLRNPKGFVLTGKDVYAHDDFRKVWKESRMPHLLETCRPGVFAAGDVRSGAMNRVASAVGEGAMAIKFVHEYLAEI